MYNKALLLIAISLFIQCAVAAPKPSVTQPQYSATPSKAAVVTPILRLTPEQLKAFKSSPQTTQNISQETNTLDDTVEANNNPYDVDEEADDDEMNSNNDALDVEWTS